MNGHDCHVWCKFQSSYTCWFTVNFGSLKDDCILIIMLASNNNHDNVYTIGTSSKMACTLSQKWLTIFNQKINRKILYHVVQIIIKYCMEGIQTCSVSVSNNGNLKYIYIYPIGKSIFCSTFASQNFYVLPLQMLTLKVYSLSKHYLIPIWNTCWRQLDQIMKSKMYKICIYIYLKTIVLNSFLTMN